MKINMAFLALSASLLSLATPVYAQDGATSEQREDVVVTAQRENETEVTRGGQVGALGDQAAENVPFSIRSFNEALILNQQPLSLGQVLENDPTIRTTYGFGNAAEQFVIRGFPLAGDDVGLNGLYGIAPRQLVAPELYDSVQVLNGASAFINGVAPGGTGIGGSVNLVTKRAGERALTRGTVSYIGDRHFGGSFDVARRFADGSAGVRVNGAYRAGDVAIADEFRRAMVIGAGLDYRGDRVRLSLDLAYQRVVVRNLRTKVTLGPSVTTVPRVPGADDNYNQAWSYTKLRDAFGVAHGEYDLSDIAMVYATFGARDGAEDGIYDGITLIDAASGDATGSALFVPRTDNNEAAQVGLRVKLASGGISHEINFGGSYVWQVGRFGYDFLAGFATNLYAAPAVPQPTSIGGAFFLNPANVDDPFPITRTRLGSAFSSDTIGLFDDRVLVTAGLRLQTIRTIGYAYLDGSQAERRSDDAITPVLGIVVKPRDGLSLFANRIQGLAQGAVAPVSGAGPTGPFTPVSNAGALFAPFKSTQYEVGGKLALGRFNASLSAFQTKQPIGQLAIDPANADQLFFSIDGEQRNRGIELIVDGEIARGLRVIAGGSVIDAELRRTSLGLNDGNTAQGVPNYTANANVEWDLPFAPGLTLTGRVVHTGEQQVNPTNTLQLGDWTRVDLGARYVAAIADRPLTLRFGVDNIANRRYWTSAYDAFEQSLLQGAPRTFRASASFDL